MRLKALTTVGGLLAVSAVAVVSTAAQPASAATTAAVGTTFVAAHSGKCLNVSGGASTDSASIIQYTCTTAALNDRWRAVPKGDGTYQIVASHSNKCLNVSGGATTNSASVIQYTCTASAKNDRFRFLPVPGRPTFQLRVEHSGKCLHVKDGATTDGAVIVQFTCGSSNAPGQNEQWSFPPATATPVELASTPNQPIVATQGAPQTGVPTAPISYAFADNLGRIRYGHQEADGGTIQWSTISEGQAFAGPPAIGFQADGRVQVVGHNSMDGDVWLRTQANTGSPAWNGWQEVGGGNPFHPTLGKMPDGKLVVFSLGPNGSLWTLPQDGTNTPYAGWRSLGGAGLTGTVTTATVHDGIRLFATQSTGAVLTAVYRDATLTDWVSLNGTGLAGTLAVVLYPGFKTRVVARAANGALVTKMGTSAGVFEPEWQPIGDRTATGSPAAVLDPVTGRTSVVIREDDGTIWGATETAQLSGVWGPWSKVSEDKISATDPAVLTFTNSSGSQWAFVYRTVNDEMVLFVRNQGAAQLAARATSAADPTFDGSVSQVPAED